MALYTREDAKRSARVAKNHKEYTIVVIADFKKNTSKVMETFGKKRNNNDAVASIKDVYPNRVIAITSEAVNQKFPYANTIKDLEVIFYNVINQQLLKLKEDVVEGEGNEPVIYVSQYGYGSLFYTFYVKVRETKSSIWLQRIGKHGRGDWQNPVVSPNPEELVGEVIMRRKGSNGLIKISQYEYADVWNGEELQEYSD